MSADDHPEHDHGHEAVAIDEFHENSWSVNLEKPRHADDRETVFEEARQAIEATAAGYHVNLVTHGEQGHPEAYLFERLEEWGEDYEYVRQCGCGGHVTRVHV
jgi:putative CGCGG family rSAM target protein